MSATVNAIKSESSISLQLEMLYEDEFVQIELDKRAAVLQLTFLQTPSLEQFRNGYRLAIDRALAKGVKLWITDARKIKSMFPENQLWLKQNMAHLFTSSPLQKFAIVMAPECFVMTNPDKVYEKPAPEKENAGSIKVHFDKESAVEWLFGE